MTGHGRLSLSATLMRTVSQEGPLALYKGFGPAFLGSVMFRSVPFAAYTSSTAFLRGHSETLAASPLTLAALGGAAGGLSRAVLETPFELAKTRSQVNRTWAFDYSLGTGLGITAARNVAVISLFWVFFEASKDLRRRLTSSPAMQSFLGGGVCSVAAWAAIFPLDTIKARVQAVGGSGGSGGSGASGASGASGGASHGSSSAGGLSGWVTSARAQARLVYQEAGSPAGFYRGLPAGLARPLVANGAGFVVYDKIMTALNQWGEV